MKLFTIAYNYNGYLETEVYASETGTTTDAVEYLKNTNQITDAGDLSDVSVYPLTTVNSSNGDPWRVGILTMRDDLINELADGWREAETAYINSGCVDDSQKQAMWAKTEAARLTAEEQRELDDINTGNGV